MSGKTALRYALVGDGESPHLLKWARALHPLVDVWVCSSRDFLPELAGLVPAEKRLALQTNPEHRGGNVALLKHVPAVGRWLRMVDADWINPHYLTSHGTLVWLAKQGWGLRGKVLASAWGSDVLVTPQRSFVYRKLTQAIVRQADLCTSDSQHMTRIMQQMGAKRIETFPFGLDALPPKFAQAKQPWLFYANRGLEPIYQPLRVLAFFKAVAAWQPQAQMVVANTGSQLQAMQDWVEREGLAQRVQFAGRLSASEQAQWYDCAQWYISLPQSDSVAVSVLEAMAHGCIPLLSDLPANRELVQDAALEQANGWIVPDGVESENSSTPFALSKVEGHGRAKPLQEGFDRLSPNGSGGNRQNISLNDFKSESTTLSTSGVLPALLQRAPAIAAHNRQWVQQHGLFAPAVQQLVQKLQGMA
ncbi:MAG: glycosyltransferase [Brachymonas sp.]|nr:glycosyltransferase [Brachymonas sp.]